MSIASPPIVPTAAPAAVPSRRRARFRPARWVLGTWTLGVFLFMHLPIFVIVLFSFSNKNTLSMPITGWTTKWYAEAFADDRLRTGLINSLKVASTATLVATLLGTAGAFAVVRYRFFGRTAFRSAVVIPILLPGIVTGVAMLTFFGATGIRLGLLTVIIGHATFGLPVVFNTIAARLSQLPRSLEEAAADLGATPFQAFYKIILPSIRSAIIAGALLAFTLSFDEIVVTIFLTGPDNTLPMEIYSRLRFNLTPEINATVTLILAISGLLVLASIWLTRRSP